MIIYAKIRRSIDYTDFILLNVHPAKIGETTLLCNQLGYVFQNEHLGFDGKACFEVGTL